MKKTLIFTFFILQTSLAVFAQKFNIIGIVLDSAGKPLSQASVMLLNPSDSSLVSFGRSDVQGKFNVRNATKGKPYVLRITYVGTETFLIDIPSSFDGATFDAEAVRMLPLSRVLNEAVITAQRDAVKMKGDTTEYDAAAFKLAPNATAEDLIRKMPGVDVERDGTVKAQGETVTQVLVNGKKFFGGNDPKLATQNLPAGAIKKVQVFDDKSEQAKFSGVDDGQREKTINFITEENAIKGVFGNASAGVGGDTSGIRHQSRLTMNTFKPKQQLSFLGLANNVNTTGFTGMDYMGFTGANRRSSGGMVEMRFDGSQSVPIDMGNNKGYISTYAGGANFNRQMSAKLEMNASYFFNNQINLTDKVTDRTNFLAQGSGFKTLTNNSTESNNLNHRANIAFDYKIDSLNSIKISANGTSTANDNTTNVFSQNNNTDGKPRSDTRRDADTEGGGKSLNSSVLWRHRFMKRGRTLTAEGFYNYNDAVRTINTDAQNRFYDFDAALTRSDSLLQRDARKNLRSVAGTRINLVEPLKKFHYLDFNYTYSQTLNGAERAVDSFKNGTTVRNNNLSNIFDNTFAFQRTGVTYRYAKQSINVSAGAQYQHSILRGEILEPNKFSVKRDFDYILPALRINYDMGVGKRAVFNYETSIREPSVDQLQPIADNSDPLNIYRGNDSLQPEYTHRFSARYSSSNSMTLRSFFSNMSYNYTNGQIVYAQTIDSAFRREWKPVNVRYNQSGNINAWYMTPLVGSKLRLSTSLGSTFGRSLALVNNIENLTRYSTTTLGARFMLNLRDSFQFDLGGRVAYSNTRYAISTSQNQQFFRHTYEANMTWRLPKNWQLMSNLDYTFTVGNGLTAAQSGIPLWGASVSKFFLKGNKGELRLSVFDIMNQNKGFNRTATDNYVQDERITSLSRYGLLTFVYSFRPIPQQGRGGSRTEMRMMMH